MATVNTANASTALLSAMELAQVVHDLAAGWVLKLLHHYPTAARLAVATLDDLATIPYLPD